MKSLQDYIFESIENDEINEGRIWDAIKKWWNNLFEPSQKKFDRYAKNMTSEVKLDYKNNLTETFDINNINIKKVDSASFNKILKPNGEEPSKVDNVGFWKFLDTTVVNGGTTSIYAFTYISKDIKDTCALLEIISDTDNYVKIKKLQIVDYFEPLLKLHKLMDLIFDEFKTEIINSHEGIILYKDTDSSLYEKLINDCDFTKSTLNNKKCAIRNVE